MRALILLLLLTAPVAFASKYTTGHDHEVVEFDPGKSCLYSSKLYGPGSTVKQPDGLYICKISVNSGKKTWYEWVKVVGAQ